LRLAGARAGGLGGLSFVHCEDNAPPSEVRERIRSKTPGLDCLLHHLPPPLTPPLPPNPHQFVYGDDGMDPVLMEAMDGTPLDLSRTLSKVGSWGWGWGGRGCLALP